MENWKEKCHFYGGGYGFFPRNGPGAFGFGFRPDFLPGTERVLSTDVRPPTSIKPELELQIRGVSATNDGSYDDDVELLSSASRQIDGYREDGPPLGFEFDDLPTKNEKKVIKSGRVNVFRPMGRPEPSRFCAPGSSEYQARLWNHFNRKQGYGFGFLPGAMQGFPVLTGCDGTARRTNGINIHNGQHPTPNPDVARRVEGMDAAFPTTTDILSVGKPRLDGSGMVLEDKKGGNGLTDVARAKAKLYPANFLAGKGLNNAFSVEDSDLELQKLIEEKLQTTDPQSPLWRDFDALVASVSRPNFPPDVIGFGIPFAELDVEGAVVGDLLMSWGVVHTFSDLLGLFPCGVDELVEAIYTGQESRLLGQVHIGLLKLLMAEMEEAHSSEKGGQGSHCAQILDEAWAWGFDVDIWRAHFNSITWPEILRQFAIAAGLGPKRPQPKREARPKIGTEGEDVSEDENGGIHLKLPTRFSEGSVKAAAWMVLAEAGPEGLSVQEIARRIQDQGLRDLSTSKTPEASVVGGLSRDVVFCRVAPATYALQSVVVHHRRLLTSSRHLERRKGDAAPSPHGGAVNNEEQSTRRNSDPDETPSDAHGWVGKLMVAEYDDLCIEDRIKALSSLCTMAADGPSVRERIDHVMGDRQKGRKQVPGGPVVRLDALGSDRRHNKYWHLMDGREARQVRIFVENCDSGDMREMRGCEQVGKLKQALEPRGKREGALLKALQTLQEDNATVKRGMDDCGATEGGRITGDGWFGEVKTVASELGEDRVGKKDDQDGAQGNGLFDKLKSDLEVVGSTIPETSFGEEWREGGGGAEWVRRVKDLNDDKKELRSCLGMLEAAISPEQLAQAFVQQPSLIPGAWMTASHAIKPIPTPRSDAKSTPPAAQQTLPHTPESTGPRSTGEGKLHWLPCTVPALYLRLLALDAALIYKEDVPPARETLHAYNYIQRPKRPLIGQLQPNGTGSAAVDVKMEERTET